MSSCTAVAYPATRSRDWARLSGGSGSSGCSAAYRDRVLNHDSAPVTSCAGTTMHA